jgi:HSP20 family molecular chaperone IbpA
MVRITGLKSSLLLGFDEGAFAKTPTDGYPPYNIEKISTSDADQRLCITFAVAGFRSDQIDVTQSENQLFVRGRQQEDRARTYLHRGIAARQFQRCFLLAEGMRVLGAELANGLLSVDIAPPDPASAVRKIEVAARD